jgi:hypothetical protein
VSEDQLFDLLAILVFIVLPFALASLGLAIAVRSSSVFWPFVGYAMAAGGTWASLVAAVSVAQCPSQDGELCGDQSGVAGDVAVRLLVVLALTYALLLIWWRSSERRRDLS